MMPFYGRVDHFQAAVESVLAQSSPDWRLVIVDDVYPDPEPGRWAQAIDDPRVTYLRNEVNLGVTGNFLRCVELAEADHLVMMGCDDLLLPRYVERVAELTAMFPSAAIIQPGVEVIDADGRRVRPLADRVKSAFRPRAGREYGGQVLATSLLRANWAYFPSVVWRRETLLEHPFRSELRVVQDLALMLEIVAAGGTMAIDDEVCFVYRRHRGSISGAGGLDGWIFEEERSLFREAAATFASRGWPKAARAARAHVTSRLHAAAELPTALREADRDARRQLLRHVFAT